MCLAVRTYVRVTGDRDGSGEGRNRTIASLSVKGTLLFESGFGLRMLVGGKALAFLKPQNMKEKYKTQKGVGNKYSTEKKIKVNISGRH